MAEIVDHNRWPGDFDHYEALLEIGLAAGKSVSWVDPRDSSLLPTIIDLPRDRPGIRISEIARLLSLDQATAEALSRAAVHEARVTICTESGDVIS
jgi:hypothetical protein